MLGSAETSKFEVDVGAKKAGSFSENHTQLESVHLRCFGALVRLLNGRWITVGGGDAKFIKKSIANGMRNSTAAKMFQAMVCFESHAECEFCALSTLRLHKFHRNVCAWNLNTISASHSWPRLLADSEKGFAFQQIHRSLSRSVEAL